MQFFIFHLAGWLRTRRFSEQEPQIRQKYNVVRLFFLVWKPNRAAAGAIRLGHFCLVADKSARLPSLCCGRVARQSLERREIEPTNLFDLAALVTVVFQKRLGDSRAAERFLREEAVPEAVRAAGQALAPTKLLMRFSPKANLFCFGQL